MEAAFNDAMGKVVVGFLHARFGHLQTADQSAATVMADYRGVPSLYLFQTGVQDLAHARGVRCQVLG